MSCWQHFFGFADRRWSYSRKTNDPAFPVIHPGRREIGWALGETSCSRGDPVSSPTPVNGSRPGAHGERRRPGLAIATPDRHDGVMTSPDALPPGEPSGPAPALTVGVEKRESGAIVLRVSGEIDLVTAPQLEESVTQALAQRPKVLVVDLTGVGFLASAGMSVLVAAHNMAGETTDMRLVASGSATLRPMELTGLAKALQIHPTLNEALDDA
jgi:anti-sigma B factor antagonist